MYILIAVFVGICVMPCVLTALSQYAVVRAFDHRKALLAKRYELVHTSAYRVWCAAKSEAQDAVNMAVEECRAAERGMDFTANYFLMGDGFVGMAQLGQLRTRSQKAQAQAAVLEHILDCQGTPQRIKDEQLVALDTAIARCECCLKRRIRIARFCEPPFMYRG